MKPTCLYMFVHAAAGHDFGAPGTDKFNGVPAKVHDNLSYFFTLMSDFANPWSVENNPVRLVAMTSCHEGGLGPMVMARVFQELIEQGGGWVEKQADRLTASLLIVNAVWAVLNVTHLIF